MRYKITLPIDCNEQRYGIGFLRGVGETGDGRIAALMRKKGFEVEEIGPEPDVPPMADGQGADAEAGQQEAEPDGIEQEAEQGQEQQKTNKKGGK